MSAVRRLVPALQVPLALVVCVLASSPWLRAFPAGVIGVPLFGAAVLSVLLPVVVVAIGVRRLALTALIDVVLFAFYELLVTLREPSGFAALYAGLVHGPAKILSYALPLVSPRMLLVAPVALCWLGGAILGESLARGWRTMLPYVAMAGVFGLSYAGSVRAVTSAADGQRYDTLLAASLLVSLLLLRSAGAWVGQAERADATQPGGLLPLRGLGIGAVLALVVGLATAAYAQSTVFTGAPRAPARRPPLDRSAPLSPLSFSAGIRPASTHGRHVFTLVTDRPASAYVSIADVDYYDGDGWSFHRTFRPSGGELPGDADPSLRPPGPTTTQQYTIASGPLTATPWMPYLYRARSVSGLSVDVDSASGMIVPARRLRAGDSYTVRSTTAAAPFADISPDASPAGYAPANLQLPPGSVKNALAALVGALSTETGQQPTSAIAFLKAVSHEFQSTFGLAGGPAPSTPSTPSTTARSPSGSRAPPFSASVPVSGSVSASASSSAQSPGTRASRSPAPAVLSTPNGAQRAGGTSFADVLASIRQFHSATPEQYATLMCLIARQIGVPARVATGFRLTTTPEVATVPAGSHDVTTAQAWTWVEIPVAGRGWVVLDASPSTHTGQRSAPNAGATFSRSSSASSSPNASISAATEGHKPARRSTVPQLRHRAGAPIVLIAGLIVAALVALVVAFLLVRKRWRSGRRRRGPPRQRLLGAWGETLDVLEESGLPSLRSATSREIADAVLERFGAEPARAARQLGDAANAAIFRPATPVTPRDADAAWATHAALTRAVRRALTQRVRLRSVLRYRRTRADQPLGGPASWSEGQDVPVHETWRRRSLHR